MLTVWRCPSGVNVVDRRVSSGSEFGEEIPEEEYELPNEAPDTATKDDSSNDTKKTQANVPPTLTFAGDT